MKIKKEFYNSCRELQAGDKVRVINNKNSNWAGIGEFTGFNKSIDKIFVIKRINKPSIYKKEVSVLLENGYSYPVSTLVRINQ